MSTFRSNFVQKIRFLIKLKFAETLSAVHLLKIELKEEQRNLSPMKCQRARWTGILLGNLKQNKRLDQHF